MSMLERLLQKVESGGTLEVGALAAEFRTSSAMIEAMLEHLERRGAVRSCTQSGAACSACSLGATCAVGPVHQIRLWQGTWDEAD
jgi:DNA-binding GntR family transcriptional regulator